MRLPRLSVIAVCAAILTGGVITASPAAAATVNYVALGDSYSSGLGAGSYDSASGACKRSSNAYPQKWASAHSPASFSFVACSGATTGDVLSGQLGALNSSTTLVSISIGGNDAGFGSVMQTCVLNTTSACLSAIATAESYMAGTLPGSLATLFDAIHTKAPSAHVVVLGYPHLYKIVSFCVGLSNTKRTALNEAADQLDTTIAKATANAGFSFGDVRTLFSGNELCSGHDWLNAVTIPPTYSYHPTALGQASGYLPTFSAAA